MATGNDMGSSPRNLYAGSRDAVLELVAAELEKDPSVSAAWLRGSLGRLEGDAVSDIDIHVAIDDERMPTDKVSRRTFVSRAGYPFLTQMVGSVPPGGFNWCVLYPGEYGPIEIDWMVWKRSTAQIIQPALVLFNRGPVPQSEHDDYRMLVEDAFPDDLASQIDHALSSCWLFTLIAAKYQARGWNDAVTTMSTMVVQHAASVAALAGSPEGAGPEVAGPGWMQLRALVKVVRNLQTSIDSPTAQQFDRVAESVSRFIDVCSAP